MKQVTYKLLPTRSSPLRDYLTDLIRLKPQSLENTQSPFWKFCVYSGPLAFVNVIRNQNVGQIALSQLIRSKKRGNQ